MRSGEEESMNDTPLATALPKRDPRALNAYKHGLTGHVLIMTPADKVAYESHCLGIHEFLNPKGVMETRFVQAIADDRWRLLRAGAIDHSTFAIGLCEPGNDTAHHPEIDDAFSRAVDWASEAKNLRLLSLYKRRTQRRVKRNMQKLEKSQAQRKATLRRAA